MKNVYLITYDLNSTEKDYSALFSEIEKLGDSIRILKSVWFVYTDKDAKQISDILRGVMDVRDHLYVVRNDNEDRQGWMYSKNWDWLKGKK